MQNKTFIYVALGALAIIIGAIVFIATRHPAPSQTSDNGGSQSNTATSTGGLTQLPVLQSTVGKGSNAIPASSDSTQPFAVNAPRSPEPTPIPSGSNVATQQNADQQKYQAAIAQGLIPDANGEYTQTVDPSGYNIYQASRYDYSLSDDNFLAKYYPDYQQINDSYTSPLSSGDVNTANGIVDNQLDASVQGANTGSGTAVPLVPNADATLLHVTNATDKDSMKTYLSAISNITSGLDIMQDAALFNSTIDASTNVNIVANQAKADSIITQIEAVSVPQPMLGLSEAYLVMYQDYSHLMTDSLLDLNDDSSQGDPVTLTETDVNNIIQDISTVTANTSAAGQYLTEMGYIAPSLQ